MPSSQLVTRNLQPDSDWWHPTVGLTWQWQIGNNDIDTSIEADTYDIDLYVDQSIIDELHAKGRKVICYISVGSWEDWRPDRNMFPPEILGNDYEGWPGEKWLDIRQIDKVAPVMLARLDLCKAKGFNAVEPDNMEIYGNNTGFPITYEDQLKYAVWLAAEAHKRGLAIGVKNAPDQVKDLVEYFDFAITEDAFYYGWAEKMNPFMQANLSSQQNIPIYLATSPHFVKNQNNLTSARSLNIVDSIHGFKLAHNFSSPIGGEAGVRVNLKLGTWHSEPKT